LKWILVGGFAALFALGIVFLWKRPQVAIAGAGSAAIAAPAVASRSSREDLAPKAAPQTSPMDGLVRGSLDELKEKLFRLELRHQAGTISDQDYSSQRTQFEQTLRDLVRG
jgi:hypothetical protein